MDETKSTEPSEFSSPLLPIGAQGYGGNHDYEEKRQKETWSVPPILILTTLVAVSGSYVFGSAVSSHMFWFRCSNKTLYNTLLLTHSIIS